MSHMGNAALAAGALAGADYLTGHVASSSLATGITHAGQHVAGQVNGIVSGTAANSSIAPVLGSAAPLANGAVGGLGIYKGYQAWKRDGLLQGIQEGSLWYSLPAGVMAALGMTSLAPGAVGAAATGLGIYGLRKTYNLGKTFLENPGANLVHGVKTPFKGAGSGIRSLWKGRGGNA